MIRVNAGLSKGPRGTKASLWKNVQNIELDCEWEDGLTIRKKIAKLYPGWRIEGFGLAEEAPSENSIDQQAATGGIQMNLEDDKLI